MKQVININFHGRVVPIEVSAFDLLKQYTESLSRYFANEEGKEEIINDIESRIGELFQERLQSGAACITDDDVNAIIKSMGKPEEFEEQDQTSSTSQTNTYRPSSSGYRRLYRDENDKVLGGVCSGLANYFDIDPIIVRIAFLIVMFAFGTGLLAYVILWVVVPSTSTAEIGGARKKLFRDPDNKVIAGVCGGISNYFGISTWIPRLLFLLPFLGFMIRLGSMHFSGSSHFFRISSPSALIIYIILWLVLPEANTTTEKLEMKGEKVDMNSIKNSIAEEMKGVQQRAEKFGSGAKAFATEKGKTMAADIDAAAKRNKNSLGDLIALIFKIIGYFIFICIGLVTLMSLFGLGVASIAVFPLKNYLLNDGWENIFAWGVLLFFIAAPIIGSATWFIRRLAKIKTNRTPLRIGFIGLWIIGLFCFIALIASVVKDFRYSNRKFRQEFALTNPAVSKLEINATTNASYCFFDNKRFKEDFFEGFNVDTVCIMNVDLRIVKSPNDSFKITTVKIARGRTKNEADAIADATPFTLIQNDSLLTMDKGIPITKTNKFRAQQIVLTIYVPVGKQIRIGDNFKFGDNLHFDGNPNSNIDINDEDMEDNTIDLDKGVDYIMQPDGLYTLDGNPVDENNHHQIPNIIINDSGVKVNTL